jgi:hypothetical protein
VALGSALSAFGGGTIASVGVKLFTDARELEAGLAKAKVSTKSAETSLGATGPKIGQLWQAGFAVAGAAIVGLAGKAIGAASDLGESVNKSKVIFEGASGSVLKFAEDASQIGLAKAQALEAAAGFGAMAQSAGIAEGASADMSIRLVQLAGDMASFNNQDPSVMLEKLRSGLAGEAEPLRQFGVFISEARVKAEAFELGLAAVGEELTDAEKIQARYNIILEDTVKAQGDFSRTLGESLPNQMRVLSAETTNFFAELGQHLVPATLEFVKAGREVVDFVGPALELFFDTAGTLAEGMAGSVSQLTDRIEELVELAPEITEVLEGIPLIGETLRKDAEEGSESLIDWGDILLELADPVNSLLHLLPPTGKALGVLNIEASENADAMLIAARQARYFAEQEGEAAEAIEHLQQSSRDFHMDLFESVLQRNQAALSTFVAASGQDWDEWVKKVQEAADDGAHAQWVFMQQTQGQWIAWRDELAGTFNGVADALEGFSGDLDVSSAEVIRAFTRQLDVMAQYDKDFAAVAARGGDGADDLLDHISTMGLEGAGVLHALAEANKGEFNAILAKWDAGEKGSKDIASTVQETLIGTLQDLRGVIQSMMDMLIKFGITADTTLARSRVADFIADLEAQGIEVASGIVKAEFGTGHTGGMVGAGLGTSYPGFDPDEVLLKAQRGEFLVQRPAVSALGLKQMELVNQAHLRPGSPLLLEYHRGGFIDASIAGAGGISDLATKTARLPGALEALYGIAGVVPPELSLVGGLLGTPSGSGTPAARAWQGWAQANWPGLFGFGVTSIRKIGGTDVWSQHAYGNAVDNFSTFATMQAMATAAFASSGLRDLAHLIFNRQVSSYGGPWHAYTGVSPHTDHVHADFVPQYAGDPYSGGYPIGAATGFMGWVNRRTRFEVAERGPEYVTVTPQGKMMDPESLVSTLTRGFARALRDVGSQHEVRVFMDSREVGWGLERTRVLAGDFD